MFWDEWDWVWKGLGKVFIGRFLGWVLYNWMRITSSSSFKDESRSFIIMVIILFNHKEKKKRIKGQKNKRPKVENKRVREQENKKKKDGTWTQLTSFLLMRIMHTDVCRTKVVDKTNPVILHKSPSNGKTSKSMDDEQKRSVYEVCVYRKDLANTRYVRLRTCGFKPKVLNYAKDWRC